ncbi:uncharacterized protein LOC135709426 [Ochlerotatus camptorhynchus]|uniref:uncharacterized protein LOC135709426 n=1 Tax=Ochlerotatus camptorhynchus TaxID=644619 RepID=UPI0031D4A912
MANMQNAPARLLITKEGFRAVLQLKGDSFQATILNSSVPRCYQLLHVPVVFDHSCTIYDLTERDSRWQRSHVQLLSIDNSQVLFIGKIGLHGGGHSCSKCATYYCDRCHYSCPNGRCYDYCSHRSDHNCASRQAAQRREQEERDERRRRAQQERDRQERIRQEQVEQQRLQREKETLERQRQEHVRLEREHQDREQRERERQERLREQREQEERERQERLKREREEKERHEQLRLQREQEEPTRQQRLQREREHQEQLRIAREKEEKEVIKSKLQEALEQTSAIRDDEIDYVSEEEAEEPCNEVNNNETHSIQQEGPINTTETDYGNLLPEAKVIDLRLLFEALDTSSLDLIDDSYSDRAISESWYKQIEIVQANSSKLIEALLIRLQNNMSEDFGRLIKRAVDKENNRKVGAEIFDEEVKKSEKQLERLARRNHHKQLRKESRHQRISKSVENKAFLQLSRAVRRNLNKVDVVLQQQLLEYVHRGGKLQTRVVKRYPVIRWIEQSLIFELIVYPEGIVDEVLLEVFKNYWLDVRESFEWQDRQKLLYSLRTKQLTHGLTLLHINDILDMVLGLKSEGLNIICEEQIFWYRKLKRCWIRRRLVRWTCDEETFDALVELLVNMPWNSLMIQQFLNAIVEERNQTAICDLLHKVKNENVVHPVVMNIINQIQNEEDCATAWIQELRYQILVQKIYELSPQVARDVDAKLGHLLRKEKANRIQNFIDRNKNLLEPNMSKFATILEHILTYQTTPDIWDHVFTAIKLEKNPEKWIGQIDKIIISSIFGKSYEYSVDELIEQTNHNNLKNKFNLVKLAYSTAALSFNSSQFTEFNSVCSIIMATNSEALQKLTRKPISEWKEKEIRHWARFVKFSPNQVSLVEKIAVVSRAVELCHKFFPRATQILSLLMLANPDEGQGRLAQINTGEGKSIIVAMLAVIHALKGVNVDIVTTSTELSIPEVKKQRPFFAAFGLTVDENSPDQVKKVVYSCDVVYGTASDFQGDILRSEFLGNDCRGSRKFQVIIVDEVDSMLFDSRNHSVRLADENPGMTHLEVPLAVIWQHIHNINNHMVSVNGKVHFIAEDFEAVGQQIKLYSGEDWEAVSIEVDDKKQFISEHTEDHLRKLLRKLTDSERDEYDAYQELNLQILEKEEQISMKDGNGTDELMDACEKMRKKLIEIPWNYRDPVVDIPEHLRDFALNQICIWVKNAILAEWAYKRDAHYTVVHGKIVPVNFNETGDLQTNMVWSDGLTQFLQMKEGLKMDPEGISTNFISNVSFFQRYGSNIYGLTGTLGEESTQGFLQEMYGTDMVVIPPYKSIDIANNENSGYRCKELAPLVLSNLGRWFQSLKENAVYHAENGRGVLVICKYINQVRHLSNMLKKVYDSKKIVTYTGEEACFEKDTINSGEIIIATNIAGRGTDFKTSKDVEKNGGMCVLVAFLPESFRVEMQNVGRTAREGKRGMAQLIVHDGSNTSMEVLKKIRQVHETQATHTAIDDAKKMLVQDSLFNRFCLLENELLPSMDDTRKMHVWDLLEANWADYSAYHLNTRKIAEKAAEWSEASQIEFEQAALNRLTKEQVGKLNEEDLRELQDKAAEQVAIELPAFRKRYTQNVLSQFCSKLSSTVPSEMLNEFKRGEKYKPKCSNLALRYKWGSFERKAIEEAWGLWLKSKHFDDAKISTEEATTMFRGEFEQDLNHRAKNDKLVQNPFFYVLKGNEELDARKLEEAVICFDRAILLDPVFSVNARFNKARALLSYTENRECKQQKALQELKKARDLIKSVYRPNLLTFNTLIGQHACLEQTSQHVQHQLDVLSQQEDFIAQACEVIETAQKNNNNVKLTLKNLYDLFSEAKEKHDKAIREAYGNGLKSLFTVEEKLPRPWGSIIAVALIGIAQIAAGCLIVMYTGGSLGSGLIAEGVADLIVAATAAIKGTFSWAAWATQKVISIAISIVCAGIASIKQTIKSAKEAGTLGLGTIKQAGKGVCNTFKSGLKDISRTCYDVGKGIVGPQGGVQLAIKEVGLALGKGVVKECLNEAGKYCTDQLFMKNLEDEISACVNDALIRALSENALVVKALEEDERNGSSYWKQLFIKEGMKLLKDKDINQCIDMFKNIAKGVAVGSIPYADDIMDVVGVGKCMHKLMTYTENFITKFNKVVRDQEKKINEAVVDSSSETSSHNVQSTAKINQADRDQLSAKEVGQAPDVDCDSSDIKVQEIREDTVYSSKAPAQAAVKLRSTYREGSTPRTLASAFKGTITGKLTASIKENIVNPAVSRVTAKVTNGLFHSMEESVTKLRNEIKTERDLRSESNALANAAETHEPKPEPKEPGTESKQMIDIITKDGHLHDTTSLALSAGAVNAPVYVYDEKGNLKYIVGSKLPGKPIAIKHFTPSNEHPMGHFCPLDPNVPVTPSGKNSCALDAIVAQLSPAQRESLQVNNASDLRDKMVEHIKANPRKAEHMFEKRAHLERIAPNRIFSGGMDQRRQPTLDKRVGKYNKRFEGYEKILGDKIRRDSDTMDHATTDQTQEHHLIHQRLKNHRAIVDSGFNIHDPINVLVCPKSEEIRQQLGTRRSVHCGRHPKKVEAELRIELDQAYSMHSGNPVELKRAVFEIAYSEREKVRSGERCLKN